MNEVELELERCEYKLSVVAMLLNAEEFTSGDERLNAVRRYLQSEPNTEASKKILSNFDHWERLREDRLKWVKDLKL